MQTFSWFLLRYMKASLVCENQQYVKINVSVYIKKSIYVQKTCGPKCHDSGQVYVIYDLLNIYSFLFRFVFLTILIVI